MMVGLKNQISQKHKHRNTGNPGKGNPQQLNPVNLKKKKTEILLDDRVKRFKKQNWEGPYYICTIFLLVFCPLFFH